MKINIWNSLDSNLNDVFNMTWPLIVISVVILSSLRFSYLMKHRDEFVIHKELFTLFFIVYILCLFQIVTFQDINGYGTNNFIPFNQIFRYEFGGKLFVKNIIGNMIMFIPYGFFVVYYTKTNKLKENILLVFMASLVIEITQLAIGRIFDIDDIILNVLGGIVGILIYKLFSKIAGLWPKVFKSKIFLDIVSILIFIGGIFLIVWR